MNRRSRRALLFALLAGSMVLAGCTATLDGGGSGTPTMTPAPRPADSPSETPPDSSTATPGECTAVDRAIVDPFREDVEPSERPEPPEEWNRSSVERYVVAFEKAYARNEALRATSTRVEVIVGDVSIERADGAWVVELTSRTNTWEQGRATGTATATVVHGDGARVPVTYRLTDRALYRKEGTIGRTPSSNETPTREPWHGPAVACFEA